MKDFSSSMHVIYRSMEDHYHTHQHGTITKYTLTEFAVHLSCDNREFLFSFYSDTSL